MAGNQSSPPRHKRIHPRQEGGREEIWAVTFLDHHSWESLSTANARDNLAPPTLITVFGRRIYEDETTLMIETVHLDRANPEYAGEDSVHHAGWCIIKPAITARTRLGLWKHPESPK